MNKALTATLAFLGLASLGLAGYIAYEHSQLPVRWKDLVPLNTPLVDQGNDAFQVYFKAGFSETHSLGITFTKQPPGQHSESMLPSASSSRATQVGAFLGHDFQWKLLDGARIVAEGRGEQSNGQSVLLGHVELKAGHTYKLETNFGPEFRTLLAMGPKIEAGIENPTVSIGLAINRDIGRPVSIGFGIAGAVLLSISIGSMLVKKRSSPKNHV